MPKKKTAPSATTNGDQLTTTKAPILHQHLIRRRAIDSTAAPIQSGFPDRD
jgi:hypothetical protein